MKQPTCLTNEAAGNEPRDTALLYNVDTQATTLILLKRINTAFGTPPWSDQDYSKDLVEMVKPRKLQVQTAN